MRKDDILNVVLQIMIAAILTVFGFLLNRNSSSGIPLVILVVPGAVLFINIIMNYFYYPTQFTFPLITGLLCMLGFAVVWIKVHFVINTKTIAIMVAVAGMTALMGTFFHLLHAKIRK